MKQRNLALALALLGTSCAAVAEEQEIVEEQSQVYEDTSARASDYVDAELLDEANAYLQQGNWEMAAEAFQEITSTDPNNGLAWMNLGYSLHQLGKLEAALPAHKKAGNSSDRRIGQIGAYNTACAYALLGDKDRALEWLGQAIENGLRDMGQMEQDPDLDSLRTDPRFDELLNWAEDNPGGEG